MKNFFTLITFSIIFTVSGYSQSKTYFSTGGEMIFSFADIKDNGTHQSSTLRWAPFFNIQTMINSNMSDHFGIFSGLAIRNVGYIFDNYTTNTQQGKSANDEFTYKKKFRTYNIGIPVGFKVGNLNKMYLYGGYEVEFPFAYKEKTFDPGGGKINQFTDWFSNRVVKLQHGFLVGVQFPYGLNLKFKYYLSEFHNQNFVASGGVKPYEGLNSHIFFFSLSAFLFRNFDFSPSATE